MTRLRLHAQLVRRGFNRGETGPRLDIYRRKRGTVLYLWKPDTDICRADEWTFWHADESDLHSSGYGHLIVVLDNLGLW
jgi:hypothetical protein